MPYATINRESKLLSTVASDIDKYRNKYSTYETQLDGSNINISFVAPKIDILENYRFYVLQSCTYEKLEEKYKYRPDYLSYYKYGTTNWWALLMWINDCKALEYFNMENVLVPTSECLNELTLATQQSTQNKTFNDDEYKYSLYSVLYRLPINNLPAANTTIRDLTLGAGNSTLTQPTEKNTIFEKEQFLMTIPVLRLRYVDLKYVPDIKSLSLIAKCKPNLVYGKHYTIISNGNDENLRLTWDPNYVTGSGLMFRLKENDIIQVTYVKN